MNNILIVEDSRVFGGLISKKIGADFPCKCIVKSSYQEAVTALEEDHQQFSLAILDLNLPDAPNGEIVQYITAKYIPAIVMTGHINDEIRDIILSLRTFDYILKGPHALEVLSHSVHRFFRNIDFHILLVDDSTFSRELTRNILTSQYFQITEASNGFDALKYLEKNPSIQLVLTDYYMPRMDGAELIQKIREKHSMHDLAIIDISARGNPLLAAQFLKSGANDFLPKPYFDEELIWRVNQNVEILDYISTNRLHRKDLEQEVQEQTNKIKKTQAMIVQQEKLAAIGQLSAGVAHEINNPIGFISSNLGTLRNYIGKLTRYIDSSSNGMCADALKELRNTLKIDFIVDDINDLISESIEGTERVKEIVNNLKNFSTVGGTEAKESDINEGLENTIKVIWNELKYKAKVIKNYGKLPLVTCYIHQLNQVFMNLLSNAVQAIESNGEITIKTWQDRDTVCISIADSGQGIPEENINKLFEPFFTTKEVGKGTGLGLSISHDIIQQHHGEITVESKVGKGTTFTITLPVSGKAAP